jgi:uncharacterized protein YdaT
MPWDETYYPQSMRNLPPEVRLKAIEIANALLEDGYDEGKAIRIAIAKAKEWVERDGYNRGRSGHLSLQRLRGSFRNLLSKWG